MVCVACGQALAKPRKKGKNSQYTLNKIVAGPEVISTVFPNISYVGPESVLCLTCHAFLKTKTMGVARSQKRKLPEPETPPTKKAKVEGKAERLSAYLSNYCYNDFVVYAHNNCPVLWEHMVNRVMFALKNEMKNCPESLKQDATMETIEDHTWQKTDKEIEEGNPIMSQVLNTIFPSAEHIVQHDKKRELEEAKQQVLKKKGVVSGMAFHAWNHHTNRFLQASMGLALWREGCTDHIISTLQSMGLCQCPTSVRNRVSTLSEHHADEITKWKESINSGVPLSEKKESYSLCWDNVEIQTQAKHQGVQANQHLMWGMCLAAKNRVNTNQLANDDQQEAVNLPPTTFVISNSELTQIRDEIKFVVKLILRSNLKCLQGVKVVKAKHANYDVLTEKSDILNLGVVDANPASTPGAIRIMQHLASYVPNDQDANCGGDGLSIERMINAIYARLNDLNPAMLSNLKATPQEFHKEILLLQDAWDKFFTAKSSDARGTIYQLKQAFKHRSLKGNVMANFDHSKDMMKFATHAYVTLFAMDLQGMQKATDTPASLPDSDEGKSQWVETLSTQIVDLVWNGPTQEDLRSLEACLNIPADHINVQEDTLNSLGVYPYCCRQSNDDDMVQCSSAECSKEWLHYTCIGIAAAPQGDFYCSDQCAQSETWIGCYCHRKRNSPIVQCAAGEDCKRSINYHVDCIPQHGNFADWYCSEECKGGAVDHVFEHSMDIMWTGLQYLSNRQAVREGNGPLMALYWKLQLLHFVTSNHYKYATIAHNFLANIGGFLSPRMREDMIWNRTANLQGRPEGNIGLDLVNEFLNGDFKKQLKNSSGQFHLKTVNRAAQLGGAFGKKLDDLLSRADFATDKRPDRHESTNKYKTQVAEFAKEYQECNLFRIIPGRAHKGLEQFQRSNKIQDVVAVAKKIHLKSSKMDELRELTTILRYEQA